VNLSVFPTARDAAAALADHIAGALRTKPDLVLGLPTGRTPVQLYRELAALTERHAVDFSRTTTFNLDEFLGLRPDDPASYRRYMERHLFRKINIDRERIHVLDGSAPDPEAECARYERAIREAGGVDLQILGIGSNGHIGFNEPGDSLMARTHRVTLRPETRRANAALFGGDAGRVPGEALSMGMATILQARSIVLLATGVEKAASVERMIHGPITTRLPASFLQLHADTLVVLDEGAARKLERRTENEERRR
jgi:glucosamine-6-phosphate deaminase